jgi:hypothetical protein
MTIEGIIWTGNKPAQKSYGLILVIPDLLFHHARSRFRVILKYFNDDFTNCELFMSCV